MSVLVNLSFLIIHEKPGDITTGLCVHVNSTTEYVCHRFFSYQIHDMWCWFDFQVLKFWLFLYSALALINSILKSNADRSNDRSGDHIQYLNTHIISFWLLLLLFVSVLRNWWSCSCSAFYLWPEGQWVNGTWSYTNFSFVGSLCCSCYAAVARLGAFTLQKSLSLGVAGGSAWSPNNVSNN